MKSLVWPLKNVVDVSPFLLRIALMFLDINDKMWRGRRECMSIVSLRFQFGNLLIPSGSHVGRSMPMTGMLHGSICICVCIVLYLCAGWSVFDCRSALAATWEATSSSYSTTRSSLASFAFSYWSSSDYSWSLNFFSSEYEYLLSVSMGIDKAFRLDVA